MSKRIEEGVTTVVSLPGGDFRYLISLKCEKLNLWLESQSSKKQCDLDSCKDEYVTTANTFVDASAADYASYFQQSLDCPPDKTQESP
ncbi:hypothetical protein PI125_g20407 [Phytophthora idaei]|nr:hypothetical protein PI125_g20407 [Phytophthora idaei]KAG3134002.1 hypothetical protein PI126_g18902 [Phytophthora idaei]